MIERASQKRKVENEGLKKKNPEDSVEVCQRGQGIKVIQINARSIRVFHYFRFEQFHANVLVRHYQQLPSLGLETLILRLDAERTAKKGHFHRGRAPDAALQKGNTKYPAGGRRNISILLVHNYLSYLHVDNDLVAGHVGQEVSFVEEVSNIIDRSRQFDGIWDSLLYPPHHPRQLRPLCCSLFFWANAGVQSPTKSATADFIMVLVLESQVPGSKIR